MKLFAKIILVCLVIAACAGLGVWEYFRTHANKAGGDSDDEASAESVPALVSVQTGALKLVTLHHYIQAYGTVEPRPATSAGPAASAELAAPSAGVVAGVRVVEGQPVEKGEVLVELNSSTMTAAYADQELERQKKLYAQQNTSLHNLQDAEAQVALLRVTAPLSGTVTHVNVKPGGAVDASTVVAEVMDLSRLAVKADVPAAEVDEVKAGKEIQVLTQPPVTTVLEYVSPSVDAASGTVSVWAALPADSGLRPGQFVPVQIVTAVHTNCLAAPEAGVVTDESGQNTIALVHGDEADQTAVQTGFRENGWVEIEGSGLKPGDVVVTVGAYALPDKTQIKVQK
jgi:multidrug efflux pump subunit AcrA (membrane-fusion protein)